MDNRSWPRLLAEAGVVIVSILIAFAVDAWWDGQQAKALEQEVLDGLEIGFHENLRLAEEAIQAAERSQALLRRFLAMSPEEAGRIPADSTYVFLRALWRPTYFRLANDTVIYGAALNNASLIATLNAGRLPVLSDNRLQIALANWQGLVDDVAQRSAVVVTLEGEVLEALASHPEMHRTLAGIDSAGTVEGSMVRKAREDDELMSAVARKGFQVRNQILFLEQVKAQANAVLTLVRANQRS